MTENIVPVAPLALMEREKESRLDSHMTKNIIPVASPALIGREKEYVLDCLESTWISSNGKYIDFFERKFAEFCGTKYGVSCCNGTAALHLALLAFNVGPGDEIIVPTLTYVATANAVTYCGAKPIFVDSEPETWNIDPYKIEENITKNTKGIIVVHLYGHPVDMDPVLEIAHRHGLFIIEDAAEAHGAEYKGQRVGTIGDIGTFSFYGNKIITTGEGGMIVTDNEKLAKRIRLLRGQGMDPNKRYWFPIIGYNYRMTNIAAAIGLAQLENIDWHIKRRRENAKLYYKFLGNDLRVSMQPEKEWAKNVYWMTSILLEDDCPLKRDEMLKRLYYVGIETRPVFYPIHMLPMYCDSNKGNEFIVSERLSKNGLNLPSSSTLTHDDIIFICEKIRELTI